MDDVKKTAEAPVSSASPSQAEEKKAEAAPAPKAEEKKTEAAPAPKAEEKKAEAAPAPKTEEKKTETAPAPKAEEKKKPAPKPKAPEPEYYTLKAKPPKKKPKEDVEAAKKIANRYLGIQALEKIVNAKKARQKKKEAAQRFKPPETPEEFYERGQRYATGADCAVPFQERAAYLRKAAEMFAGAGEYNDAAELAQRCAQSADKVEQEGYENAYAQAAQRKAHAVSNDDWFEAARAFERIPGYLDADEQAAACQHVLDRRSNLKRPLLLLAVAAVAALLIGAVMFSRTTLFRYHLATTMHHFGMDNVAAAFLSSEGGYRDSEALLDEIYYSEAVEGMSLGDYKAALSALEKCSVSTSEISNLMDECHYALGDAAFQEGHYKTAKDHFKLLSKDYKDRKQRINECNYHQALDSMKEGDWAEAINHFRSANGYADSDQLRLEPEKKLMEEAKSGDKILFGTESYTLLQRQGSTLTLLSNTMVHDLPYNQQQKAVDWAHCTLRSALNSDSFLDEYFSEGEQAMIQEFEGDRVSILDQKEYLLYQDVMKKKEALWWLKDQGDAPDTARFVSDSGHVMEAGYPVDSTVILVRPVVRITLAD